MNATYKDIWEKIWERIKKYSPDIHNSAPELSGVDAALNWIDEHAEKKDLDAGAKEWQAVSWRAIFNRLCEIKPEFYVGHKNAMEGALAWIDEHAGERLTESKRQQAEAWESLYTEIRSHTTGDGKGATGLETAINWVRELAEYKQELELVKAKNEGLQRELQRRPKDEEMNGVWARNADLVRKVRNREEHINKLNKALAKVQEERDALKQKLNCPW